MDNQKWVKVLWVENDPLVLDAYPMEAESYGIDLVAFECWDDAEKALLKDYDSWDAIVLDAKCKHHKDSADKATTFLMATLNSLSRMAGKNNHQIPWFILSGGSEEEIEDLIPDERELWDLDRREKYYRKATDRETLWRRIPIIAERTSKIIPLRTDLYRDVFSAISECDLNEEVESKMISLLLPLHFKDELSPKYNGLYINIRLIIEHIFRSMAQHGIMPKTLFPDGKVNLTWCCYFLQGKADERYAKEVPTPAIMTRIMSGNLQNMINVTGSMMHTDGADEEKSKDIKPYLESVNNSPLLLQSFALQLCDIILWYRNYLAEHPDSEINALSWTI